MPAPLFLTDRAHDDVDSICSWWSKNRSVEQSECWYRQLVTAFDQINTNPDHSLLAGENYKYPFELRQANFGLSGKRTHRILFTIRPDMILVLRVLHLARDALSEEDL